MCSQVSVCPRGRRTPPWQAVTPWADTPQADTRPQPEMATAADGTHPTGMYSCFKMESICTWLQCKVL